MGEGGSGLSPAEIDEGLGALRLAWGTDYLFGYDDEHGWWVIESGRLGSLLTASSPGELGEQLAERDRAQS